MGRKSLWTVPRTGGTPTRFHEFGSNQIHSGIGVSPDGRRAAYVDRADDGFFQIFRMPLGGGDPEKVEVAEVLAGYGIHAGEWREWSSLSPRDSIG